MVAESGAGSSEPGTARGGGPLSDSVSVVTPCARLGVETLVAESAVGSSEPGTAGGGGPLRGSVRLPWPGSAGYDLLFSLLKRRHLSPLAPCHFLRRYDVTPPLTASVAPCLNALITYFFNAFCIKIAFKCKLLESRWPPYHSLVQNT